jgi:hypothetical protein
VIGTDTKRFWFGNKDEIDRIAEGREKEASPVLAAR